MTMQQRLAGTRLAGAWRRAAGEMRGHTFHYSRLETPLAPVAYTVKHPSGAQGEAVYRVGSLTASYFHALLRLEPGGRRRPAAREAGMSAHPRPRRRPLRQERAGRAPGARHPARKWSTSRPSQAGDAEMAARIAHHRARRPAEWRTVEEPTALAADAARAVRAGAHRAGRLPDAVADAT